MYLEYDNKGVLVARAESLDDVRRLIALEEEMNRVEKVACMHCDAILNGEQGLKVHMGLMHRELVTPREKVLK